MRASPTSRPDALPTRSPFWAGLLALGALSLGAPLWAQNPGVRVPGPQAPGVQDPVPPGPAMDPVVSIRLGNATLDKAWALVDPAAVPAPWPTGLDAEALTEDPEGTQVLKSWRLALSQRIDPGSSRELRASATLRLCLIAKAQARDEDAWEHLKGLIDFPTLTARALPYLWPGVPMGTMVGPHGRVHLQEGALLTPAFPPLTPRGEMRRVEIDDMHFRGRLKVGGIPVDLRATLPSTGLELDISHAAAKPVTLRVQMPRTRNYERDLVYSDWDRMDDADAPVSLTVPPDREKPWTLFARLKPNFEPWPATPEATSPWFENRSLVLVIPKADKHYAATTSLAEHLAALLKIPVTLQTPNTPIPLRATAVHLSQTDKRKRRVRRLISSAESFLLTREEK